MDNEPSGGQEPSLAPIIPIDIIERRRIETLAHVPAFVDKQFEFWSSEGVPKYQASLVESILAESSPDPSRRPGKNPKAQEWEARLAAIVSDPELDEVILDPDDKDVKAIEEAKVRVAQNTYKLQALAVLEQLLKAARQETVQVHGSSAELREILARITQQLVPHASIPPPPPSTPSGPRPTSGNHFTPRIV